jgi:hypothetical protein
MNNKKNRHKKTYKNNLTNKKNQILITQHLNQLFIIKMILMTQQNKHHSNTNIYKLIDPRNSKDTFKLKH